MDDVVVTLLDVKTSTQCMRDNITNRDFNFFRMEDMVRVIGSPEALIPSQPIHTESRKAVELSKGKYVVWSPEVEEFLEQPLHIIENLRYNISQVTQDLSNTHVMLTKARMRRNQWETSYHERNDELNSIRKYSFWKRVCWLFGGMPE